MIIAKYKNVYFLFAILTIFIFSIANNSLAIEKQLTVSEEREILNDIQKVRTKIDSYRGKPAIFTPDGYAELTENNLDSRDIAIGKGIIAVRGNYSKNVKVSFYTPMPNTVFSVKRYEGITKNKSLIYREGETIIPQVISDNNGIVTYTTNGFSTQILSFPDPLEHSPEGENTGYYLNFFFEDYDRVRITSTSMGLSGDDFEGYMTSTASFEDNNVTSLDNAELTLQYIGTPPSTNPRFRLESSEGGAFTHDINIYAFDDVDDVTFVFDTFDWEYDGSGVTILDDLNSVYNYNTNTSYSLFANDFFSNYDNATILFEDNQCNSTVVDSMITSGNVDIENSSGTCYIIIRSDLTLLDGGGYINPNKLSIDLTGLGDDIQIISNNLIEQEIPLTLYAEEGTPLNATLNQTIFNYTESTGTGGATNLLTGLEAWYFETNSMDSLHEGGETLTNTGCTWVSGTQKVGGGSWRCDADAEYMYTSSPNIATNNNDAFSIGGWIKLENDLNKAQYIYDMKRTGDGNDWNRIYFDTSANTFIDSFRADDGVGSTNSTSLTYSTDWQHFVVTFNVTGGVKVYRNGVLFLTQNTYTDHEASAETRYGAHRSAANTLSGLLNGWGEWSRALSPEEIIQLNNSLSYEDTVASVPADPPVQIQNFPSEVQIEYDDQVFFDLNDYFSTGSFNNAVLYFSAFNLSTNLTGSDSFVNSTFSFDLIGETTNIRWLIDANTTLWNDSVILSVCNEETCINESFQFMIVATILNASQPTIIQFFNSSYTIGANEDIAFNLGGYFDNYNALFLEYQDETGNQTSEILINIDDPQECINETYIEICVRTLSTELYLEINSLDTAIDDIISLNITNPYGSVSQAFIIEVDVELNAEDELTGTQSLLVGFFNWIIALFPDAEDLTAGQKLLYVVISISVVLGLSLAFASKQESDLISSALTIIGVLIGIILLFFFVAINYLSVIVIVVLGLITVGIATLIFRKTTIG